MEDKGRERFVNGGNRDGEEWKWRMQGGREVEVEDTGKERSGSGGYTEGKR